MELHHIMRTHNNHGGVRPGQPVVRSWCACGLLIALLATPGIAQVETGPSADSPSVATVQDRLSRLRQLILEEDPTG